MSDPVGMDGHQSLHFLHVPGDTDPVDRHWTAILKSADLVYLVYPQKRFAGASPLKDLTEELTGNF